MLAVAIANLTNFAADGTPTSGTLTLDADANGLGCFIDSTFGWLMHCRRLVRDYELLPETTESWIYVAMILIMVRRLT